MILAQLRRLLPACGFFLLLAGGAWAQTTTLQGVVKDAQGKPLKGAVINIDRTDMKGHWTVASKKKGDWLYTGLPYGTFNVSCVVDGKVADMEKGVKTDYANPVEVDFDLQKTAQQQAQTAQANANGQLTEQQQHSMSKEEREKYEAAMKQREAQMKKNKALNDAYNAGKDALTKAQADTDPAAKVTDYQAAITSFQNASQLDPSQVAVWDSLGDAYYGLGGAQTGDDKTKSYDAALAAYNKVLDLDKAQPNKVNEAAIYNQIGNIYGAEKKIPEATDALTKAAQLDPTMASKAYFNMGANLVNGGHPDQAADFFKKATDADPNYAEAWYQYGSLEMMKGTVDPKTGKQSYPPETATALKKYLELEPNGKHAQEATAMLQAMGETVQTKITNPNANTGKKKR